MREFFSDPSEFLSDADPTRRAQIQMQKPLARRFYSEVGIVVKEGSRYEIRLDGIAIRTPAKNLFVVPTARLAELVKCEWLSQSEVIDPVTMPVTRLVNTAIDGVAIDPQAVFDEILRFSQSDLLCYRASEPRELAERQSRHWDPVLDWSAARLGARFILAEGIVHREQPAETVEAFAEALRRYHEPLKLAALQMITTLTGSAILALAVAEGEVIREDAWRLAHLDEDWTDEHWGIDAEAQSRREKRQRDFLAAVSVLDALRN